MNNNGEYINELYNLIFLKNDKDIDEITKAIYTVLLDRCDALYSEINYCNSIELLIEIVLKYRSKIINILKEYIEIYCENNKLSCEKLEYNSYLINNKSIINVNSGFNFIYNKLKRIKKANKRKKLVKKIAIDLKDTFIPN